MFCRISFLILLLVLVLSCQNESSTANQSATPSDVVEKKTPDSLLPSKQKLQSGKLNPVDEGQLSPDFHQFRQQLLAAIDRKDVGFIRQIVAKDIKIGFGGEDGVENFLKMWSLDQNPQASDLWQVLRKILLLGGTFDRNNKNVFLVPYLTATWPDELDAFEYVVITGEGVRARETPGMSGKVLTKLSYDIVRLGEYEAERDTTEIDGEYWPWIKIWLPDKRPAYVYGKFLHSPIDYRAAFERRKGKWQMIYLVAGD